MEIKNNCIIISDTDKICFDEPIIEAAIENDKVFVVFQTIVDNGFDNLYCFTYDKHLLWRIKQAPREIGGTVRATYVGVSIRDNLCYATDFFGRCFFVNPDNGEIIGKEIVK